VRLEQPIPNEAKRTVWPGGGRKWVGLSRRDASSPGGHSSSPYRATALQGVGDLQARYNSHCRLQACYSSGSLFFKNIIYYFIFTFIDICFYLSNLQLCPGEGVLCVGQEHLSGTLLGEAASEALPGDNATP